METIKDCQMCNKEYVALRSDGKFCSQKCAWTKSQTKIRECPTCEQTFTSSKSKYCSSDCKKKAGKVGLVHNGVVGRKSAVCLGCGKEFTRPASYASKMHYCSNKCSHSERKRVRDRYVLTLHEDAIIFRSYMGD